MKKSSPKNRFFNKEKMVIKTLTVVLELFLLIRLGSGIVLAVGPDVNNDGLVNAADMRLVLSAWGGSGPCSDYNCDVYSEGKVNSLDAGMIISHWTGGLPTPTSLVSPSPTPTPSGPTPTSGPPGETYFGVLFFQYGDPYNHLHYVRELGLNSCWVAGGWITSGFEASLGPMADAGCKLIVIWGPEIAPHLYFNNPLTPTEVAYLSGLESWCLSRADVDSCAVVFIHESKNWEQLPLVTPEEQQVYYRMLKGRFPNLEFFNMPQIWLGEYTSGYDGRHYDQYLQPDMCDICDIALYPLGYDAWGINGTVEQFRQDKAVADTVVNSNGQTVKMSLIAQPMGIGGSLPGVETWRELACKVLALRPYNLWIGAIGTPYADDNLNHEDYRRVIREITSGTGCSMWGL